MHVPAIRAVSHVDHYKRVALVSISIHACGSVPLAIVLRLVAQYWSSTIKAKQCIVLKVAQ